MIKQKSAEAVVAKCPSHLSALDSVMCVLIENCKTLKDIDIAGGFAALKGDKDFENLTSINMTDAKTLQDRFAIVRKYFVGG